MCVRCRVSLAAESRSVKAITVLDAVRDGRWRIPILAVHISWSGYTMYSIQGEFITVQWEIYHSDLRKHLCVRECVPWCVHEYMGVCVQL